MRLFLQCDHLNRILDTKSNERRLIISQITKQLRLNFPSEQITSGYKKKQQQIDVNRSTDCWKINASKHMQIYSNCPVIVSGQFGCSFV